MSEAATIYAHRTAEGGWRIADSRLSLASVVCAYWEGKSPEAIAEEYPTLSAEQVYGAIAFYLRNKQDIDDHLSQQNAKWEEFASRSNEQHGPLLDRLRSRRPSGAEE